MHQFQSVGLVAAAILVTASLSPAGANLVRPQRSHVQAPHQLSVGNVAARRGGVSIPRGRIADAKGMGYVYVSDYGANVVYGYGANGGSPTFTVSSGISGPQGLGTSRKNLYVANTNDSQVLVYTPPSTTPTMTINDNGEYPAGVAVNKTATQIWVSNICNSASCGMGNLSEFDNKGNLKQTITCSNLYRYYFVAIDKAGNVAVDGEDASGFPEVDYVKAGQNTCNTTNISLEFPGGVQFTTSGNLAVGDQDANTITVYAAPSYSTVVSTTSLNNISDPVTFAFTKPLSQGVWTANAGSADATLFNFPAGGNPTNTISGLAEPIGIAVHPTPRT